MLGARVLLLACVPCAAALAQTPNAPPRPITQLVHTRWSAREGAPTQITALAQTTDGYLWVGTWSSALFRFDGVRFVPVLAANGDTVRGGPGLLGTRDGSLWIVEAGGSVTRLSHGRVTTYKEKDGLPPALAIAESRAGVLVAGTRQGLAQFVDGAWRDVSAAWGYPATFTREVWFDRHDGLWAHPQGRVLYRPAGGDRFVDAVMVPKTPRRYVSDFAETLDGTVWITDMDHHAHTIERPGERRLRSDVKVNATSLLVDRKGTLWIGTLGDGLRRVVDPARIRGVSVGKFGSEAETYTQRDGLSSDVVNALLEDREGNIWVGTTRGLEQFREGAFTPYPSTGSIRQRTIYAARDSSVWVATFNRRDFVRIHPGRSATVAFDSVPINLVQDLSGTLWTVRDTRIFRFDGGRWVRVPVSGLQPRQLVDITIDRAGTVWLLDSELGLLRLVDGRLIRLAPPQDLLHRGNLFSDRLGRVWIILSDGVALYDQGQVTRFQATDGPGRVQTFFEDRAGNLWTAGYGALHKFEGGKFLHFERRFQFAGKTIFGVVEDDEGASWLLTTHKLLRLPPGEFDRAMADSTYVLRYRAFDQVDGLPGMINSAIYGPLLARTPDGRIWVATDSGVASLDPRHLPRRETPTVVIENLRLDGRELPPSEGLELPARSSNLEIDYTAPVLSMPERVQFRYRLEGEDPEWVEVGTRRRAYYTRLGPGTYRFQVAARDGEGTWNEASAALSFRVLPAWYQTAWFMALALGALAAGLWSLHRLRVRQLALREQRFQELARVSRIASLGALTASIAHEVNQPLSGIVTNASTCLRMLGSDPPNVAGALETARRTIRDGHRASEVITHLRGLFAKKEAVTEPVDLNEAIRELLALAMGQLRKHRVMVRTELAEDLPAVMGDRVQLQQVCLNLIMNAADAMMNVRDRPRELLVKSEHPNGDVRILVQDTGVGFDPEAAELLFEAFYSTKTGGMGIGLSVSRSIIERHHGRLWGTRNPGHGATFAFSIPALSDQTIMTQSHGRMDAQVV
jgi:signal transduction histidine kinase/ligand-binding sensor domain-containing protein